MNKYQKALERLENITSVPSIFIGAVVENLVITFKELVDKETSMQPNNNKREEEFETTLHINTDQEIYFTIKDIKGKETMISISELYRVLKNIETSLMEI